MSDASSCHDGAQVSEPYTSRARADMPWGTPGARGAALEPESLARGGITSHGAGKPFNGIRKSENVLALSARALAQPPRPNAGRQILGRGFQNACKSSALCKGTTTINNAFGEMGYRFRHLKEKPPERMQSVQITEGISREVQREPKRFQKHGQLQNHEIYHI